MKIIIITCFLVFSMLTSFSQVKTNFTQQDYDDFFLPESVPKDLKKNNHILMVWTPFKQKEEKENQEIKEIFEKYYKGKFVICPNDYRKFENKDAYEDKNIYKYAVKMFSSSGIHIHYRINLMDRPKFDIKETQREALISTGLEDAHKKLNKMLAFYAERLGAAKE